MDNILIRVAWYDKKTNKYDYGSWHHFSKFDYKKKWVEEQNKNIPLTRYWIEGCNNNDKNIEKNSNNFFSNIETFNVIKNENEFLLL